MKIRLRAIFFPFLLSPLPLPNAWSASVCQYDSAHVLKNFSQAISLNSGSDLFRARCAQEWDLVHSVKE